MEVTNLKALWTLVSFPRWIVRKDSERRSKSKSKSFYSWPRIKTPGFKAGKHLRSKPWLSLIVMLPAYTGILWWTRPLLRPHTSLRTEWRSRTRSMILCSCKVLRRKSNPFRSITKSQYRMSRCMDSRSSKISTNCTRKAFKTDWQMFPTKWDL